MSSKLNTAVDAAIAVARRHVSTASLAAALVPLGSLAAHATIAPSVSVTQTPYSNYQSFGKVIEYSFTNTSGVGISTIELPEVTAGDLNFNLSNGYSLLPVGWTASESSTSLVGGSGLKSGKAGAYIELSTNPYATSELGGTGSTTMNFFAKVPTLSTVSSNFSFKQDSGGVVVVDPGVPDTAAAAAVPEPASLALLAAGVAAVGLRRTRRQEG